METKHGKTFHKKKLIILVVLLALAVMGFAWAEIRQIGSIFCQTMPELPASVYSENERVMNAVALSYLVYGFESCDDFSGTVSELLDTNEMGILKENYGIKRTDADDPSTSLFDTSAFIRQFVGNYRYLLDRKDEKSGFYGAAFCDDEAKCVWITFSGAVTFRDAIACVEFVLAPRLSDQEKQAIKLYNAVAESDEVQNQAYHIILTGHSFGGTLATIVSCASGCSAVTVNGADGIAIDKFIGIEGSDYQGERISNYMTIPQNGHISMMDLVQSLMFLGKYKAIDYHVYAENGYTTDTHCAFSFIQFEEDALTALAVP